MNEDKGASYGPGSRERSRQGASPPVGFDPSREGMTNAKYLWIVTDLQRQLGCEVAALAYGTWNPRFCAADASQRALRIFAEVREKLDHWEAFARDSDGSGEAGETALASSTEGDSAGRSDSGGIAHAE